jgi:hypothetical protein
MTRRKRRSYRQPKPPGLYDPVLPHDLAHGVNFWKREDVRAGRKAHLESITKSARDANGILRRGLFRVRPKALDNPQDKERWATFMHVEIPFKEGFTTVLSGMNKGDYLFVDKSDAALFKLWWG